MCNVTHNDVNQLFAQIQAKDNYKLLQKLA